MNTYYGYINLEHDNARRAMLEKQFTDNKLEAERIPARGPRGGDMWPVMGKDPRYNLSGNLTEIKDTENINIPDSRLAEIGLLCSQVDALKHFLKSGKKYGVICEDDVVLPSGDRNINCERIFDAAPPGADTIMLFSFPRQHMAISNMEAFNNKNRPFLKWTEEYFSTVCYLITREGAEKCLKRCGALDADRILCFNCLPVADNMIYKFTNTYVLSCPIVFPRDCFDSTIHREHDSINRHFTEVQKNKIPCKTISTFTRKSNLIFSSVGNNTKAPSGWANVSLCSYDIIQYRYSGEMTLADSVFRLASKFQNLDHWIKENRDLFETYDYILVVDDDIPLTPEQIELLFKQAKINKAQVSSPSFDPVKGKVSPSLEIMASHPRPGSYFRRSDYVEVTAPLFSRQALSRFMDVYTKYADRLVGWGIDHLYRHVLFNVNDPFYIFDNVVTINPRDADKPLGQAGGREIDKLQSTDKRRTAWYSVAEQLKIPRHTQPSILADRLEAFGDVISIPDILLNSKNPREPISRASGLCLIEISDTPHGPLDRINDENLLWINKAWTYIERGEVVCMDGGWVPQNTGFKPVDTVGYPAMLISGRCLLRTDTVNKILKNIPPSLIKEYAKFPKKREMIISLSFRVAGIVMRSLKVPDTENKITVHDYDTYTNHLWYFNNKADVTVITPTYKRREHINKLIVCLKEQTFEKERMEWVILDDSPEYNKDAGEGTGIFAKLPFRYYYVWLDGWNRVGRKRNILNRLAIGNIIVSFDDDDLHHPERIKHTVKKLKENSVNLAGSTHSFLAQKNHGIVKSISEDSETGIKQTRIEYMDGTGEIRPYKMTDKLDGTIEATTPTIYKLTGRKGMGFGRYHSTAGLMGYYKSYAIRNMFGEDVEYAEEPYFTNKFNEPMVQLDPWKIILISCHRGNTYDKIDYIKSNIVPRWMARVQNIQNGELLLTYLPREKPENCIQLGFGEKIGDDSHKGIIDIKTEITDFPDGRKVVLASGQGIKLTIILSASNNGVCEPETSILETPTGKFNIVDYDFTQPAWKNQEKTEWSARISNWAGGSAISALFDIKKKLLRFNGKLMHATPEDTWDNGKIKTVWEEKENTTGVVRFEVLMNGQNMESARAKVANGYQVDFITGQVINPQGWVLAEPWYDAQTIYIMSRTRARDFTKNRTLLKTFEY